ncbi:hypothetical protein Psta_3716 [Pirellula staleyi DSM 6068]|uniref:Uncharacterized protein n=1 Tax=Pirellula staleyi (strain ATCC 27377 / DSM 6068 / ICPB 4128) TaxID=530564 RepID=D2R006_PIRSD|nr:hypothetical protein Psta_3716 [Pirellula staleyi DSM 6068]
MSSRKNRFFKFQFFLLKCRLLLFEVSSYTIIVSIPCHCRL